MIRQTEIRIPAKRTGCFDITKMVLGSLPDLPMKGLVHLYLQHTSAGLTINESYDPAVMHDFDIYLNRIVPRDVDFLTHTIEGPDDMPSHVKTALVGTSVSIPVIDHQLGLGRWQGIWLCEFRDIPRERRIWATVIGD